MSARLKNGLSPTGPFGRCEHGSSDWPVGLSTVLRELVAAAPGQVAWVVA
jgi:hypothetical protein